MINIGTWVVGVSYVASIMVAFLKCIPFDHQWQINPSPGSKSNAPSTQQDKIPSNMSPDHCMPAISSIQTIFVMVMNTITDFYLMAIPLPVSNILVLDHC